MTIYFSFWKEKKEEMYASNVSDLHRNIPLKFPYGQQLQGCPGNISTPKLSIVQPKCQEDRALICFTAISFYFVNSYRDLL